MYSKVTMLLWERWMRTRWAIIVSCLLPIIGLLIYRSDTATQQNIVQYTLLFWFVGYVFLIMVLLAGQCEMRDMDLAFPNRIFKLPVSTTTLFTVHLSYGITSIALPFLVFWGVEKLFSDTNNIPWSFLFFFETLYVALQTLSWLGGPWSFLYLFLLLAGLYPLKKFSIMLNLPMGGNIRYMMIIILSCVASYWSLFMCRHGAWLTNWKWVSSFAGVFKMRVSKPFSSAMQAQIWFESKQTGYILPLSALCIIVTILVITGSMLVKATLHDGQLYPLSLTVQPIFFFTIPAAGIGGLIALAIYYREYSSGSYIFLMRRPMRTQTLAVARLYATVGSLVRLCLIFLVFVLAIVVYDWAIGKLDINALSPMKQALEYNSRYEVIIMSVLGFFAFTLFYWTLYRIGPVLFIGNAILNAFISIIWDRNLVIPRVYDALVVILPLCVLVTYYVARRQNLITNKMLVFSACAFPVVVISLFAFPWSDILEFSVDLSNPNRIQIIYLISAGFLPFIPVVATPLIMNKLRHR